MQHRSRRRTRPLRVIGHLFPDSERLLALGDFSFFALEPLAVRFIEGFGSIHWISAAEYLNSDIGRVSGRAVELSPLRVDSLHLALQFVEGIEAGKERRADADGDGPVDATSRDESVARACRSLLFS